MKRSISIFLAALLVTGFVSAATINVDSNIPDNTVVTNTTLSVTRDSTNVVTDTYRLKRGYKSTINSPNRLCVQYTVAHVDTNIVVALEGSLGGTNFFNLDEDGNTTVTSNGTSAFVLMGASVFPYVRLKVVSCQGDSTTTIAAKLKWGE